MTEMKESPSRIWDEAIRLMESERAVVGRVADSVLKTSQLAALATPELQSMFQEWLDLTARHVLADIEGSVRRDVPAWASELGVTEQTLFSLLVCLNRAGLVQLQAVEITPGTGRNTEVCRCSCGNV